MSRCDSRMVCFTSGERIDSSNSSSLARLARLDRRCDCAGGCSAVGGRRECDRPRRDRASGSTRIPWCGPPVDGGAKPCRGPLAKARRATFGAVLAPIAWFATDPATKVRANAAVGDDDARDVDAASAPTRLSRREDIAPKAQPQTPQTRTLAASRALSTNFSDAAWDFLDLFFGVMRR